MLEDNALLIIMFLIVLLIGISVFIVLSIIKNEEKTDAYINIFVVVLSTLIATFTVFYSTKKQISFQKQNIEIQEKHNNNQLFIKALYEYYNNKEVRKIYYEIIYNKVSEISANEEISLDTLISIYNNFSYLYYKNIFNKEQMKLLEFDFKSIYSNKKIKKYLDGINKNYKDKNVESKIKYYMQYCREYIND